MFWKYNLITASHIETLLEKEDVALKELMDEDDILQECKGQRQKLIDFLVRQEVMEEMVTLITQEPDENLDEKVRYKYPNIACELLTFDIAAINDALAADESLLNKLYLFLASDKPLNPLLASFFSKTMGKLIIRKTDVLFDYLQSKADFIALLINHIETSAIMDLITRLLTFSENIEMRGKVINWLSEQNVIRRLVGLIDPAFSKDYNCNAAHALCDMIKASREHMSMLQEKAEPDPLLDAIESTEVVSDLLDHMFNGEKVESVIVNGISVLLALLEFKKHGPASAQQVLPSQNQSSLQAENGLQTFASLFFRNDGPEQMTTLDAERLAKGVNNVLAAVTPRLVEFHKLLLQPPPKAPITLTFGVLDPPLGYSRLEDAHLITALITTNTHSVNVELAKLGTFPVLMDLFFHYVWNNFLHTQVEHAVGRIISNPPTVDEEGNKVHPLLEQFLMEYKMTERLLECYKENESDTSSSEVQRKGYMGHLTKIANHISQNVENGVNSALIQEKLKQLPDDHLKKWEEFVSGILAEINKKNTAPLVSGIPMPSSSEEDSIHFRRIPFSQESALQQAFSNCQVQQISSNFVGQYCFNEDFNETEDNLTGQLSRLADVHFHLSEDYLLQRNVELFEQVCREKSHSSSSDPDSDEDVWDEKEDKGFCHRERTLSGDNSSDSDDDANVPSTTNASIIVNNEDTKMDVDNQDAGWASNLDSSVPMEVAPTTIQNPWETVEQPSSTSDEQENWADFSSFSSFGTSNVECSDEITSSTAVAMETSDSIPTAKFVSSSEVSSTSDSTPTTLTSNVPVNSTLIQFENSDDRPECETSFPAAGDASSIEDFKSEAKALSLTDNEVSDSNKQNDSTLSPEKEACASSTVQNGPV